MLADVLALIDLSQHYDKQTMKQRDIADRLFLSDSSMSEIVRKLKKEGYMEHSDEFKTRRSHAKIKYNITEKGKELLEE